MLFAVGAVTGTVLSFEMGLLWPRFMERFGRRLRDRLRDRGDLLLHRGDLHRDLHLRLEPARGLGALLERRADRDRRDRRRVQRRRGQLVDEPAAGLRARRRRQRRPTSSRSTALFNPATVYEFPHMLLAAYMVVGFGLASMYAVAMLRDPAKRDRRHRLGLLIPLTVAAIVAPIQIFVGDVAARGVADHQPAKFAGDRVHRRDGARPDRVDRRDLHRRRGQVRDRDPRPGLARSSASAPTPSSPASNEIPDDEEPPAEHAAAPRLRRDGRHRHGAARRSAPGSRSPGGGGGTSRRRSGSCAPSRSAGSARSSPSSAGWIVTEVGRQPWIVWQADARQEAVTDAGGLWFVVRRRGRCSTRRSAPSP